MPAGSQTAAPASLSRRRARRSELVARTRELFDGRGVQEVSTEEIAKAAGLNRALIYRCFESKEELFVLTVTQYLDELTARGRALIDPDASAREQLQSSWENFADYCLEYPAFLDCALSLMRRPADELQARLTESAWLRLGRSMSACLGVTESILRRGIAQGELTVSDPAFIANCMYTATIGTMHLARSGVGVSQSAAGEPQVFPIEPARIREACVQAALGAVAPATG